MKLTLILLATLIATNSLSATEAVTTNPATNTSADAETIKSWRDARFGMFIHWGPVSLKGTEIGWSRGKEIPIEEYDNLYKQFNPTKFDADQWVAVAKAAGMKYIVLTSKHHDGFCLWDTKQTDYNIMNSPFGRDVVKELSAACKKADIAFGTYHSTCDWHHPDFPRTSPGGRVMRKESNIDAYTQYLKLQSQELLNNYGPLFTLWYDVPQEFDAARGQSIIDMVREIQPDIMINNRTGAKGDYDTPEQRVGGFQIDRPWETCMTICKQWAWKPNDKMKSLEECLQTLIRTNGGDGNLLFNVGPMPSGEIEPRQVERLKEMGEWLAKNGESLYQTRGGPWKPSKTFVSTRKDNKIYLHILAKPSEAIKLPALPVAVRSAKLLHGPAVTVNEQDGFLAFDIPADYFDSIDTIVELSLDGSAMELAPLSPKLLSGPWIQGVKATASTVFSHSYEASNAVDDDPDTRWATPAGTTGSCWIEFDLPQQTTIGSIEIDEAFSDGGSRVLQFELQRKEGDAWTTFHRGSSIGEQFETKFAPVNTRTIRLHILKASEGPTFSEVRLFRVKS